MATIDDIDDKRDALTALTEHAEREKDGADREARRHFERVLHALQDALRQAETAHAQLVARDVRTRATATAYHASLAERGADATQVSDAVDALIAELATRLGGGITEAEVETLFDQIHDLGATLRSDLDDAQSRADAARTAWFGALGDVENARAAIARLERRIGALDAQFDAVVAEAHEHLRRAHRHLGREEETNDRTAAVWGYFARRASERLTDDYSATDDGLEVGAGSPNAFLGAWESAWNDLVDAEDALHEAALDLHRALLEERIAAAALHQHETSLPFAFDAEIAAIISGF